MLHLSEPLGKASQPAWLLKPLQPITAAARGPDADGCLPAVPKFSPLCRSQKAVWAYPLTPEVARQRSLKQIQERNSNIITGHVILGSVARRLVVQRTWSPMSKHPQSLLSSNFFLFWCSNHTPRLAGEIDTFL